MKLAKKTLAVLFSAILVLSTCIGVFAVEPTGKIEVTGAPDGHVFTAYQIFTGDVNTTDSKLENIKWGADVTTDAASLTSLITALQAVDFASTGMNDAVDTLTNTSTAASFAGVFEKATDAEDAKKLGSALAAWKTGTGAASTEAKAPYTVTNLADGWYLVVDTATATAAETGNFISNYILQLAGEATIATKGSAPTLTKTATDFSINSEATAIDVAVGDSLNFTLLGTLPSNYADYTTYPYTFKDTPANLKIDSSSVKLFVGTVEFTDTTKFTVSVDATTGVLTVDIPDAKALTTDATKTLKVTYTASVTNGAASANATNSAEITYANNPNAAGTGKTTSSSVTATTQSFKLVKYDGADSKLLAGAKFNIKNGNTTINFVKISDTEYRVADADDTTTTTEIVTVADIINIKGLDADVTYTLHEASAPTGYSTAQDSNFTVSAATSAATPAVDGDNVYTTTANVVGVANNSGSALPQTGSTGTVIFIVIGAVAVIVAGIFLVTNKRISKEDI